jgi:hypothetical protein
MNSPRVKAIGYSILGVVLLVPFSIGTVMAMFEINQQSLVPSGNMFADAAKFISLLLNWKFMLGAGLAGGILKIFEKPSFPTWLTRAAQAILGLIVVLGIVRGAFDYLKGKDGRSQPDQVGGES